MAIRGGRFLELAKAAEFTITGHALTRLSERAGRRFTRGEAFELFLGGAQLTHREMMEAGHRPAYRARKKRGVPSWYFSLPGLEGAAAVVTKGKGLGEFVWVTTYAANHRARSNRLRDGSVYFETCLSA